MQVRPRPVRDSPVDGQGTAGGRGLYYYVEGHADGTALQLRKALLQPLRETFRQGLQVHESVARRRQGRVLHKLGRRGRAA